ncbi:MAG: alpha/beta hydrolase [Chthoniobacterales bacterium]
MISWIRLAVLSLACLVVACAPYGLARPNEKIVRNVEFATPGGQSLRLDIYLPKSNKPVPVVMWIFGGSWKFGSKGYHVNLRDLTRSGIAVASIDYRLSGTAVYPAQLEDCKSALAWLRAHGAEYGIDPTRIGVSGESAGGHLAALLGTLEGKSKIKAVCALYPPTNLVSLGRKYKNPDRWSDIERLLGGPIETKLALAREASPVNRVSADAPPFLIIHGAQDTLVPIGQSHELDRDLRRVGVESRIIVVPDKGHWFQLDETQLKAVAEFFQRHFATEE